ncbi:MAG: hypothetical protein WKF43_10980 [Acidimicrobiales bacterium]
MTVEQSGEGVLIARTEGGDDERILGSVVRHGNRFHEQRTLLRHDRDRAAWTKKASSIGDASSAALSFERQKAPAPGIGMKRLWEGGRAAGRWR